MGLKNILQLLHRLHRCKVGKHPPHCPECKRWVQDGCDDDCDLEAAIEYLTKTVEERR